MIDASTAAMDSALALVSAARMAVTVETLAADRFAGRRTGTPGGVAAAGWLADQLAGLGAAVHTDAFPVATIRELQATPTLAWAVDGDVHELAHRRDFAEHLASAELSTPRSGPLADVRSVELRDRWVLAPAQDWVRACDRAERESALGVLVPRGADPAGWMPKMLTGPPPGSVPLLWVRTDVHDQLTTAADKSEVSVTASVPLRPVTVTGTNIHAALPAGSGSGAVRVLLTAHYDGVGDDPCRRFPAAADNASGVAAVLEAARVLTASTALPALDLAVAFPDAEEAGAIGSAHHAPQLPPETLVINLDGAAQLQESAAVEAGGPAHGLLAALDQAGRHVGVALRGGSMASDNRRFAAAGLAAIGIGMGMPGYQTPAETPDRVEPDTLLAAARLLVATVWRLAISSDGS